MLLAIAPLVFALLVTSTPLFQNATISTLNASNIAAALDVAPTSPAYFNPAAFINPYFYIVIDPAVSTDPDRLSSAYACSSVWDTSFTSWLGTAEISTGPVVAASTETTTYYPWVATDLTIASFTETLNGSTTAWTSTSTEAVSTVLGSTVTTIFSGYGPQYLVPASFDFTASQPCCESCTIQGGTVKVFYWPSSSPSISTLTNSNNFTFVYPSTYVAFQSIHATDMCGDVGPIFASTTMAFEPGELSTSIHAWVSMSTASSVPFLVVINSKNALSWRKATFGDQQTCGPQTTTKYAYEGNQYNDRADAVAAASSILLALQIVGVDPDDLVGSVAFTLDPCSPTLSIPTQILTVAPQWSSCIPPLTAFYDPPFPLSPGSELAAFGTSTSAAAPIPSAQPELASVTFATPVAAALPTKVPSPATSKASPTAPSPSVEIQPVQIITVSDSSALSPPIVETTSADLPVDPATSPSPNPPAVGNNGEPPVPVSSDPVTIDPGQILTTASSPPAVLSIGSSAVTADISSNFVLASQTLTRGGEVTLSGIQVSLASDGDFAVIGGTTTQIIATAPASPPVQVQVLNFGSLSITADQASDFVIASQTLAPGGVLTISGTTLSLASDDAFVVLDGTITQTLATATTAFGSPNTNTLAPLDLISATTSSSVSIGGIILSAGGFATNTDTTAAKATGTETGSGTNNGTVFSGRAAKMNSQSSVWILGLFLGIGILGVCWL